MGFGYLDALLYVTIIRYTLIVLVAGRATVDEPWMVRGEPTVGEYDH